MKTAIEKHLISLVLLTFALVCVLTNHPDAAGGFVILLVLRTLFRAL